MITLTKVEQKVNKKQVTEIAKRLQRMYGIKFYRHCYWSLEGSPYGNNTVKIKSLISHYITTFGYPNEYFTPLYKELKLVCKVISKVTRGGDHHV
jgi:hypothetical protein